MAVIILTFFRMPVSEIKAESCRLKTFFVLSIMLGRTVHILFRYIYIYIYIYL